MDEEQAPIRPRRRRIAAAVALALAGSAATWLWVQREPIARSYVDDALAARGVQASYRIAELGVTRQRIENIRIGDPKRPDLTAQWAELSFTIGFAGPALRSIKARGVRLRGRLVDGTVSLGSIDRLLPPPSGAPFSLPDMDVDLSDARMRLETPAGVVGIAIEGEGNLSDGFEGRMAAVMRRIEVQGCAIRAPTLFVNVAVADRKPSLDGPLRAASVRCAGKGVEIERPRTAIDIAFSRGLDSWEGNAVIEAARSRMANLSSAALGGRIGFNGGWKRLAGELSLFAADARFAGGGAARAAFDGRYAFEPPARTGSMLGEAQLAGASFSGGFERKAARLSATPVGPVAAAMGRAAERALARFDGRATIALVQGSKGGALRVERLDANARSGARLVLRSGAGRGGVSWYWPRGLARTDGELLLAGGGLPETRIELRQARAYLPRSGTAEIVPYAAGGARLALAPVRFGAEGRATRFDTRLELDGPLGDGRIEGLAVPLQGFLGTGGAFAINPGCTRIAFDRLHIAGMALERTRLPLCATGDVLIGRRNGVMRGGGRIVSPRLAGRVGESPLTIAARSLGFEVGRPGFAADTMAVRLGTGEGTTRLDVARLVGTVTPEGVGGHFEEANGKIGNVPLLLSEVRGRWGLSEGVLTLAGGLRVADAAAEPRFNPLRSEDVRLRLAGGVITATGTLLEPASGARVSDVTLRHDLSSGVGHAVLDVPGISFTKTLQPETLTRLTLGVVANVEGTMKGRGEIRWNPEGVTSEGVFRTDSTSLAAAFGPVSGIKGEIRFTDLLGLETAPGQVATLGEVNPGVAVNEGVIRYQLLPGQRIKVESGRWPFSGGELLLDETILDMAKPSDRRLTFRVIGMDAALFVQQFNFKNISVTGTFDGVLPMVFDAKGGRIESGRMVVRRGGGTLAYVGELSNENLGTFGKLAFDALKSIKYDRLAIELNGSLDGEIVSRVLFNGINEAPTDGTKKLGMFQELTGLPFKFNITITAPFRSLINSAQSLTDPRGLISQALPPKEPLPGSSPVQTK